MPRFDPVRYLNGRTAPRFILGIAGVPGAGKSTFAHRLASATPGSIVLPMDGFHLSNARLGELGLSAHKGAPETYDAAAFVEALRQVRDVRDRSVGWPAYSRELHEPVADAIQVQPNHRIVIVEGNYLLVAEEPWRQARRLFDEVWYLQVGAERAAQRVRQRHLAVGRSPAEAELKLRTVDLPNGVIVRPTRARADRILLG